MHLIDTVVFTDGRTDCLARTLASFAQFSSGRTGRTWIIDDSGDPDNTERLCHEYLGAAVVHHPERLGFGGTIADTWERLAAVTDEGFVLHLEDDFVLERSVDWQRIADVLDAHPHLVQLALRRQPWNEIEIAAGGVVESRADEYDDCTDGVHDWLEQRMFFTTNPSLYRRSLATRGWPNVEHSEGMFTHALLAESSETRFGFWGARDSGVWVEHIGATRVGTGY